MLRRLVSLLPQQAVPALAQTSSLVLQGLCLSAQPLLLRRPCCFGEHALLPVVLQTARWNSLSVSPSHSTNAMFAPALCARPWAQSFASAAQPAAPDYFSVLGV